MSLEEIRAWLGLFFAPFIALAGWLIKVEVTQSRQADRIARIEADVKQVKDDQHQILEKLDDVRMLVVTLTEQVKTLFKERDR